MILSAQSQSSVSDAVKEALQQYVSDGQDDIVTDIHFQPLRNTGELVIWNDEEEELSRAVVPDWLDYDDEGFYKLVEVDLRAELEHFHKEGMFDDLRIMKPYSLVLVDDEKEALAELLLIDEEETVFISDELLKGLDEELDNFLKELLEK